jgi:hypothetical protein
MSSENSNQTPSAESDPKGMPAVLPRGERRAVDRRTTDRREGDRRKGDRRRGDRRFGEPFGQDWRGRRIGAMRRRTQVLIGVLLACILLLLVDRFFFKYTPPAEPMVVVRLDSGTEWRCPTRELAFYFAASDVMAQIEKTPEQFDKEAVRNDKIALKIDNYLKNTDQLIKRVQEMPWEEFERRAKPYSRNGASPTPEAARRALQTAYSM